MKKIEKKFKYKLAHKLCERAQELLDEIYRKEMEKLKK